MLIWNKRLLKFTKNALVVNVFNAIPQADWKNSNKNVKIEEETEPCGRLMFRNRGDDGNVDFGVSSIP